MYFFFSVGYSQNEGDSMHARIENEANIILKGDPIYQPSQWVSVIKCAKKMANLIRKPSLMNYKTSYSEELFQTINIRQKMRKPLTSIPENLKLIPNTEYIHNLIFIEFAKRVDY
ncbi:Uncharacterized protein FWK35_00019015 [Aphis craccivora]|uniref:Uncharacterized protein n=1 Tax=Aphis craccivora TaxID=307492 RepID=A0A6G0Y8Q6_APHCR|nr:Uncharacterized protein FWK35_00019015 [Aphis craccivora]